MATTMVFDTDYYVKKFYGNSQILQSTPVHFDVHVQL